MLLTYPNMQKGPKIAWRVSDVCLVSQPRIRCTTFKESTGTLSMTPGRVRVLICQLVSTGIDWRKKNRFLEHVFFNGKRLSNRTKHFP